MNLAKAKSLFLKILIACLITAAVLAVVTILIGKFNSILSKALFTIVLVAIHSLLSFGFIANNEKQDTFENLGFFTNATFGIIILSFVTSILGTWNILPGSLVAKLYAIFFVLLFAALHGEILSKATGKQATIDKVIYANYCFMAAVIAMLLPVIFTDYSASLGNFYYRLLAAVGIVDATLTLVAVILHKLYLQKHPQVQDAVFAIPQSLGTVALGQQPAQTSASKGKHVMNIFVIILITYVALQFIGFVAVMILGASR